MDVLIKATIKLLKNKAKVVMTSLLLVTVKLQIMIRILKKLQLPTYLLKSKSF